MVFIDESRFCLWVHDGRRMVRRFRGELRNLQLGVECHAFTPEIMVWGSICFWSRSLLVFLQRNLNTANYITDVLEPYALQYLQGLINSIFSKIMPNPTRQGLLHSFWKEYTHPISHRSNTFGIRSVQVIYSTSQTVFVLRLTMRGKADQL